jgi:hypothetical protein
MEVSDVLSLRLLNPVRGDANASILRLVPQGRLPRQLELARVAG